MRSGISEKAIGVFLLALIIMLISEPGMSFVRGCCGQVKTDTRLSRFHPL